MLYAHALGKDVEQLRRIWNGDSQNKANDPLSTLATAAVASQPAQPQPHPQHRPPSPVQASTTMSWSSQDAPPYPTPNLPFDQQMPPGPSWAEERKRKRQDEHPAPVRPQQPTYPHRSETTPVFTSHPSTLAPMQDPSHRPPLTHATYAARPPMQHAQTSSTYTSSHDAMSPNRLHISNLVSPAMPGSSRQSFDTDMESERRWSSGDVSVIDHSLSYLDPTRRLSGEQGRAVVPSLTGWSFPSSTSTSLAPPTIYSQPSHYTPSYASSLPGQSTSAAQIVAPYASSAYTSFPETFTQGIHQSYPTFAHPTIDHNPAPLPPPPIPLDLNVPRMDIHPAILACRSLLLSILPSPLPYPLPRLPPLEPAQQKLLLLALTALVPVGDQAMFHQRQLKFIPAGDAKRLLQYQSDPSTADARLILFPIAIMRAKIVKALQQDKHPDITRFINDTISSARIYGATLDPDAWEMPGEYWEEWEEWIPRGRAYCHSLSKWRRRDGHMGSSFLEMILGTEKEHARRTDPVGRPPNWTF